MLVTSDDDKTELKNDISSKCPSRFNSPLPLPLDALFRAAIKVLFDQVPPELGKLDKKPEIAVRVVELPFTYKVAVAVPETGLSAVKTK